MGHPLVQEVEYGGLHLGCVVHQAEHEGRSDGGTHLPANQATVQVSVGLRQGTQRADGLLMYS